MSANRYMSSNKQSSTPATWTPPTPTVITSRINENSVMKKVNDNFFSMKLGDTKTFSKSGYQI